MFYDERIESVKGRISRNAIFMSVIISIVLGSIRLANVLKNTDSNIYLCFIVLESIIALGGLLCLMIGCIHGKRYAKDERILSEQSSFYNKASSVLIKIIMAGFAFFLPINLYIGMPSNFSDPGFDSILTVLFFIIGIYVIYSFRRNDIYFNYSIMEHDHYYKSVFKNIGKLALYVLSLAAVSALPFIIFVAVNAPSNAFLIKILLQIASIYVGGFIELSLLYLLYSFLERASYNSTRFISKSSVISLSITILIYALYTAIVTFVDLLPISQADALKLVSVASPLGTYINFALLVFLTYFGYEYQKGKANKLLSTACLAIILSETLAVFLRQISGCLINVFVPEIVHQDAYIITQIFATVVSSIENSSNIANAVGFALIILALIKDKTIKEANIVAIFSLLVLGGIEIFLHTQVDILQVTIYHSLTEIGVLCYLCILAAHIGRRQKEEIL